MTIEEFTTFLEDDLTLHKTSLAAIIRYFDLWWGSCDKTEDNWASMRHIKGLKEELEKRIKLEQDVLNRINSKADPVPVFFKPPVNKIEASDPDKRWKLIKEEIE